jgi:hypothetical protein
MPSFNDYFESKYLSAHDLDERERFVVVDRVSREEVGREREKRPVVSFVDEKKPMILNKTNFRSIANGYGQDDAKWKGAKIILYSTPVEFQGEMRDAIRIKIPRPDAAVRPAAPPNKAEALIDDDVPF